MAAVMVSVRLPCELYGYFVMSLVATYSSYMSRVRMRIASRIAFFCAGWR